MKNEYITIIHINATLVLIRGYDKKREEKVSMEGNVNRYK